MFGKDYDFSLIRTSSKEALKRTALLATNYDIKKASEIYDYFAKDMPNLPDTDPILPTAYDQVKETAVSIFKWGQQNQDTIIGAVNMVLSAFGKSPITMPTIPIETPPAPPIV